MFTYPRSTASLLQQKVKSECGSNLQWQDLCQNGFLTPIVRGKKLWHALFLPESQTRIDHINVDRAPSRSALGQVSECTTMRVSLDKLWQDSHSAVCRSPKVQSCIHNFTGFRTKLFKLHSFSTLHSGGKSSNVENILFILQDSMDLCFEKVDNYIK